MPPLNHITPSIFVFSLPRGHASDSESISEVQGFVRGLRSSINKTPDQTLKTYFVLIQNAKSDLYIMRGTIELCPAHLSQNVTLGREKTITAVSVSDSRNGI